MSELVRISLICAIALFLSLFSSLPANAQKDIQEPFENRLEAALAELDQLNLSVIVALSHDSNPIIVREFGILKEDGILAAETQVDINSITKSVTAMMILKLVEQSKVRLDESLAEIFTNVPQDKAKITIHHLLTHSSGFTDSIGSDFERLGKKKFLKRAFKSKLLSEPGKTYHYSNVGFAILAAIVEERSGKSYEAYLHEDTIAGLGLKNIGYMSVYDDKRSIRTQRSKSIISASWGNHEPYWNLIGNGGLVSTAEEFVRFRLAVNAGRIVSLDLLEHAKMPHVPEDDYGRSHYGYGLVVQDLPQVGRFYWHDGGNSIFSAQWNEYPTQNDIIFIAGLWSDDGDGDAMIAMRVIDKFLYGIGNH